MRSPPDLRYLRPKFGGETLLCGVVFHIVLGLVTNSFGAIPLRSRTKLYGRLQRRASAASPRVNNNQVEGSGTLIEEKLRLSKSPGPTPVLGLA